MSEIQNRYRVPDVQAKAQVVAPCGVSDEPGTPFGVVWDPLPLIFLCVHGEPDEASRQAMAPCAHTRSCICIEVADDFVAKDVLEVMNRLGLVQVHLCAEASAYHLAQAVENLVPTRIASCIESESNLVDARDLQAFLRSHEQPVHQRNLVEFHDSVPQILSTSSDVIVLHANDAHTSSVLALYDRLLDACEQPGRESCGWKRSSWPNPDDVQSRLHEGMTWIAVAASDVRAQRVRPGTPVLGAMSLDHDLGLPGVLADWDSVADTSILVCHLLATDPEAHGRGIGTSLLAAYAREALTRGCSRLRINTSPESYANRLYHELGFVLHKPVLFPYEGLDLTPWTCLYELKLDDAS